MANVSDCFAKMIDSADTTRVNTMTEATVMTNK